MLGPMSWRWPLLLLALVLGACTSAPGASRAPSASAVALGEGLAAQRWGDGAYGVVLLGSLWELDDAGAQIAADRMTVLAPEALTLDALEAGITWLREEAGLERVAVVAGRDGAEAALTLGAESPELVDQLIVVDADGTAASLGPFPKLFLAVQTDVSAAQRLADEAPGEWNEAASAVDEAGLLALVLDRLEERR